MSVKIKIVEKSLQDPGHKSENIKRQLRKQLESLEKEKYKGAAIRCRVTTEQEDIPTKQFLAREQNIQNRKVIKEMRKKNGEVMYKHQEILEEFKSFYQDLYNENIIPDRSEQNYFLGFTKKKK